MTRSQTKRDNWYVVLCLLINWLYNICFWNGFCSLSGSGFEPRFISLSDYELSNCQSLHYPSQRCGDLDYTVFHGYDWRTGNCLMVLRQHYITYNLTAYPDQHRICNVRINNNKTGPSKTSLFIYFLYTQLSSSSMSNLFLNTAAWHPLINQVHVHQSVASSHTIVL